MLTIRLAQLGLLIALPLIAKIDPADWSVARTSNEEEALFLRRIADFWQEGEYGIAKSQMEAFLSSFPESRFSDPLRICLGDILLREKNFSAALASYADLSPEFEAKAFLNRMQCLYNLEWYSTLADVCERHLKNDLDPDTKHKTTFYLAIALYHQCLNASKEPEMLLKLAKRAEPHFETLLESDLSLEVSQAFAHLCCILKEYRKAVNIYHDLAAKEPLVEDEMNFQAALIQAEYDKDLAIQSFEQIEKKGQVRAKEAAYNRLILSFEAGRHDEIANGKEGILASLSDERNGMGRFFIGRSLLALKKYSEAIVELTAFLKEVAPTATDSIRSGLLSLIEAAHQAGDVAALDMALLKLSEIDPSDEQIAKGRLLRSMLLKNLGRIDEAREEFQSLLAAFSSFPDRSAALFEWADLEYQAGSWEACRSRSYAFLEQFTGHELAPFAWRYLATASSHISNENIETRERFAKDLEALLDQKSLFSIQEASDWKFYLARAYVHLGHFEKAAEALRSLLKNNSPFPQEANAHLLLGLALRDGFGDTAAFCEKAETAIAMNADLMDPRLLHVSLFNAYLEQSNQAPHLMEKSAEHLYEAFAAHAEIAKENLLWLGDWYLFKQNEPRASKIFSALLESAFDETACYKLGKLYSLMGRFEDQIPLLENLISSYRDDPSADWKWERESKLLLAEAYISKGCEDKALGLLNEVADGNSATRSETVAKAYLEKARISAAKLKNEPPNDQALADAASQFKDLILQRRLEQEPIHLEAAIEYVDLLETSASNRAEKRLALLEKIKKDFENTDNLLSKDYHQARLKYPTKNRIFEAYMRWIDEEILLAQSDLSADVGVQKELQAKAKDLLLQIKSECDHPALLKRVSSRLQNADVSFVE